MSITPWSRGHRKPSAHAPKCPVRTHRGPTKLRVSNKYNIKHFKNRLKKHLKWIIVRLFWDPFLFIPHFKTLLRPNNFNYICRMLYTTIFIMTGSPVYLQHDFVLPLAGYNILCAVPNHRNKNDVIKTSTVVMCKTHNL